MTEFETHRENLFVSYARLDADPVGDMVERLRSAGSEIWMDTGSIEPSAIWMDEIQGAIDRCSAVVAFLSPSFLSSPVCREELELARSGGKRLIPVLLEQVDGDSVPSWLSAINWVIAIDPSRRLESVDAVLRAAQLDLDWSAEHSRLQVRAREWDARGRHRTLLLRGDDITIAEAALLQDRHPQQPQPTPLQREFVTASRRTSGRVRRVVVALVAVVALVSCGLAVIASVQRNQALSALAESNFRRLISEADGAPNQSDALHLALRAQQAAKPAGRSPTSSLVPLIQALSHNDRPIVHFVGRTEDNGSGGEHQGTSVSGDGSSLAYVAPDGSAHLIDLWTLSERARVPAPDTLTGESYGIQVGLDHSGGRLIRAHVPEYPADGSSPQTRFEIYDLTSSKPTRTADVTVTVPAPASAVGFGPRKNLIVALGNDGTMSVLDVADKVPSTTSLGTPQPTSNADWVGTAIARDGTRACSIGSETQLYQVDPPAVLTSIENDRATSGPGCIAEPCGVDASNVMVDLGEDGLECVADDGSSRGTTSQQLGAAGSAAELHNLEVTDLESDPVSGWSTAALVGEDIDPGWARISGPSDGATVMSIQHVVPGPVGPQMVRVTTDGDIEVWTIGSGVLPLSGRVDTPDGVGLIPAGQALGGSGDAVAIAPGSRPGWSILVDAATGERLPGSADLGPGADAFDTGRWLLDDRTVLTVTSAGQATVWSSGGKPVHYKLDLPDSFEHRIDVDGDVLAYSTGSGLQVIEVRTGRPMPPTLKLAHDEICAVDVTAHATVIGLVTCGKSEGPVVVIWDDVKVNRPTRRLAAPFRSPTSLGLAEDGGTAAVGFAAGEIGVLQGRRWMQPAALTTVSASHNDYMAGWVALEPSGHWLVTGRDGNGLEAWHLEPGKVTRAATLSRQQRSQVPEGARFLDDRLTLSWDYGEGGEFGQILSWSLADDDLRADACVRLAGHSELSVADRFSGCERSRASIKRPRSTTTTTSVPAPLPGGATAVTASLQVTTLALTAGGWPSAPFVDRDGAVWLAESSAITAIDRSAASVRLPIGSSPAEAIAQGSDGTIWFAGFQVLGEVSPDRQVRRHEVSGRGASGPLATWAGDLVLFSESFEPTLTWIEEDQRTSRPLPSILGNASVDQMVEVDGEMWLAATPNGGRLEQAGLARLSTDLEVDIHPIEGAQRVSSVAEGADGSVWFAGVDNNDDGLLGIRQPGGSIDWVDLPKGVVPGRIVSNGATLWFTAGRRIGRVEEGKVSVWPIADAGSLSGLAVDPDGSLWVTDSESDALHHVSLG